MDPSLNAAGTAALAVGAGWPFLAFLVYWLRTGSWTVLPDTMTTAGTVVFIGPVLVILALYLVGPRGGLRRFYRPPLEVQIDEAGLTWGPTAAARRHAPWRDIHGADVIGGTAGYSVVYGAGIEGAVRFDGRRYRDAEGRRWSIPAALVAVRPDCFELTRRESFTSTARCALRRDVVTCESRIAP